MDCARIWSISSQEVCCRVRSQITRFATSSTLSTRWPDCQARSRLRKYDASCSIVSVCGQSVNDGQPCSDELIGSVPAMIASSSAPQPRVACEGQPASATGAPPEAHASPQCIEPPNASPAVTCACASIQPTSLPFASTGADGVPLTPVAMSGIAAHPVAAASFMVALPAPSPPRYDPICWPVDVETSRYCPVEPLLTVQSARSPYESPAHTQPSVLWYGGAPVWSRSR